MNIIYRVDAAADELKRKILLSKTVIESYGNSYYVSNDGNDTDDGSAERPWATLEKVTNTPLSRGDTVFFRRGDTFRGRLVTQSGVTYSAYGDGEKPIICGSAEDAAVKEYWIKADETKNIWRFYKDKADIGAIFFNGGKEYAARRCPAIADGKFEYGTEILADMQFICLPDPKKAETLNNSTFSGITGPLYLRCDRGNPGEIFDSAELTERSYLVTVPDHSDNIVIDNLAVKYGGAHGIGGGYVSGLTVQNCEIAYIGGGIQSYFKSSDGGKYTPVRYGNGVELHTYCNGYTVKNCWVHDIYDAGITHQQGGNHSVGLIFKDVSYTGNLIENCIYSVEYFANKSAKNGATVLMENIRVADNIMRYAGCGFGSQRTLEDNCWNVGTHINGWYGSENLTNGNFVIENNIFDRALYSSPDRPLKQNTSLILVSAEAREWLPSFNGNTYICEKGNQFAYRGGLVKGGPVPFVKAENGLSAEEIFEDKNGKIYILQEEKNEQKAL